MATVAAGPGPAYPVHVAARPVPDNPSRALWLVKWILVIPHAVVLALLWAAFVVLSVVALVAIVVTGRYPRAIFDFNVGVLRWSWRVAYYSYGALGTDRYPPFTLRDVPDYPARLDVEYPERLSRGLVLVKWWLLVLPHYLLLVLLLGAGAQAARQVDGPAWVWEGGLIALLCLFAGAALLFTGAYPRGLYELLLGLNRWVLRVAAYAGLMTDVYPPFRLDQGGPDPGLWTTGGPAPGPMTASVVATAPVGVPGSTAGVPDATAPPPGPGAGTGPDSGGGSGPAGVGPESGAGPGPAGVGSDSGGGPGPAGVRLDSGAGTAAAGAASGPLAADPTSPPAGGYYPTSSWSAGRVVAVVAGSVAVLLGLLAVVGGITLLTWQASQREDGYVTTPTWEVDTPGYAAVTDELVLRGEWLDEGLGDVRLRAVGHGGEIFLGVASAQDAAAYLDGVAREMRGNAFVDSELAGGAPAVPPADTDIWIASATGSGPVRLDLEPEPGSYVVVVMAADGGAGVHASVDAGATLPWLGVAAAVALVSGFVLLGGGLAAVVLAVRAASRVGRRQPVAGP